MASLIRTDLDFILQQILVAEAQANGADPISLVPNTFAAFGLRTVDGTYNNLLPGQSGYGAADNPFPRLVDAVYRDDQDGDSFGPVINTNYGAPGSVADADPRIISNLIADQTITNPAAVQAFVEAGLGTLDVNGVLLDLNLQPIGPGISLHIPNTAPDEGLSASFNSWFTFFGQFFDHGLDLVNKGGNETIFMPLQTDDPLYVEGGQANFMVLTRATLTGTEQTNQTTPFVDQNQTYTSHPSHQVFLREYAMTPGGPVATGRLLDSPDGGLTTWAQIKAQALNMLGIQLDDLDALDLPLLATDAFGKFIPDPLTGFPQMVVVVDDGPPPVTDMVSGTPLAPVDGSLGVRTGHAFLNDIAHAANPLDSQTGQPLPPGGYDAALLDAHFITGDGRGNENIALTTIHHVFHSEHNRQIDEIMATVTASGDADFIASWHLADGSWNGERLFQAARFATEMQYQHLVFEEFARKMAPSIDEFLPETNYQTSIDPAIVAEFAHAVFRVGHSMLTDTIDRMDADFNTTTTTELVAGFLNPLGFNPNGLTPEMAAGDIVRGMTRQVGNEIDEFVVESVRNNLLGLPLDLAAINIARGRDTGIPTLNAARREFFQQTHDAMLRPYTSWADLTQHLKHEASAINFIAAYGTHAEFSALDVDTAADKRAVAVALAMGGTVVINAGTAQARNFTADEADRIAFLNSTGQYAMVDGITTTGVDDIDLWIGGLAEQQMPFGGMLGSTFNFVFENQMEALQNGDRFYYLSRLAGLNFLTEMENNTFAKLVMLNTDATHLPADIFSAPGFILEVNQIDQYTGLGASGRDDPVDEVPDLIPLVIRDNPGTTAVETTYLQYTGGDHVVLGGTNAADTLIASIGDDTIYGDGGNDRIEGGDGNDHIMGGLGDDIITDRGGDDVIKGDEGNDVIQGGNGANLIIAGAGNDFVITGEDVSEVFAGPGDDFVLGSKGNLPTFGNEGNDWIELGTQDGTTGDSFDPLGQDSVRGNDVLISGGGFDELIGEGGDDIFTGSDGEDHFDGGSGFDWANYKFDKYGVSVDMIVSDLIEPPVAPSNAGIMDRFAFTEGLSGSAFADVLRGDDADATEILDAGFYGSVLTNIGLINGLAGILPAGMTSFGAGNIILGGDGSDIIQGRGGDDIIDGDAWLNVRIQVTGHAITSVDSLKELVPYMLSGEINPGQLSIVREILTADGSDDFDTAVFSGLRENYTVIENPDGTVTVTDNVGTNAGTEGTDRLRNIERLQFSDEAIVLVPGLNAEPVGQLVINDNTPSVNQLLNVQFPLGITDADNASGNLVGRPVSYVWQYEPDPVRGAGVFRDIVDSGGSVPATADGTSFRVTSAYDGLALRVRAVYQDDNGVLENVFSAATAPVAGTVDPLPVVTPEIETLVESPGVRYIRSDLQFILDQILISERHAAGEDLLDILPNSRVALGLRTVDGSYNNLVQGQSEFGAADTPFPRLVDPVFRPGYAGSGNVTDPGPRIISNLIVDQTDNNPAAVALAEELGAELTTSPGLDGIFGTADDKEVYFFPNTAPDEGLSAPFNAFMTFFGQFFDHGLDLVSKGGNGTIFVPLQADDPLFSTAPGAPNFLLLTRATQVAGPGADGVLGTSDDTVQEAQNGTTPFVDQNQTYTSHPSHQVFVREYAFNGAGDPVSTGRLITGRDLVDGVFGNADDVDNGGMSTWGVVKAQARDMLGILLDDMDALDLPLLATDAYGKFIPDPATGFAQIVLRAEFVGDAVLDPDNNGLASGGPGVAAIDASLAVRSGHAFLNDIAHTANPVNSMGVPLEADSNDVIGLSEPGAYDDELLDAHYIAGDGRVNENIALTAVHHVFHAEHNRLVELTKEVIIASNDPAFIANWQLPDGSWNGERLFQAARFGTEMQYQHLVFEEFARKIQPQVDIFFAATQVYDTEIDPSIVAEFAHTVYRFGHSMLTETVDRFDANFNVIGDPNSADPDQQLGLIAAFLNPLAFAASGPNADEAAGALARGLTRQAGNQIDEFVTEALRNNLLGLPLDLASINIMRGRDTGVPSLNAARRDFYTVTGDSQLKPYSSWIDLTHNLKHEASLINFIAAYGTHATITAETSVEGKRLAAMNLVFGDPSLDAAAAAIFDADRMAFLNSTGEWAPTAAGGPTITGVDAIDLWIGGLAEKIMPFGGMLGSTFNFVFEEQMEKLQDGDRFYYLERTQGLNFLTELENNSFARMIMANTDAVHLPGDVFSTPGFTLEVNIAAQHTGIGLLGNDDPDGVLRNDPGAALPNPLYLKYSGDEHVVLGGTAGNDTIISSLGDDTVYGDGGNDRLEGGFGNDFVLGGDGNDIMTDSGGDDNMQGGDGNDAIHGGNGLNLILGGFGHDFIVTGEDPSEAFGGPGNDFILGARGNEFVFGNEGDDWIEFGMADGSAGENFDAFARDETVGNDVFIGNTISDRMDGEGGDDIMQGNGGQVDRYEGGSGYDWASFRDDQFGVSADLMLRAFDETPVPLSNATVLARFTSTEGMSGSQFSDVLRGDDNTAAEVALSGATGSVLTNMSLINGLQTFLNQSIGGSVSSFAGNIILGGGGSDILEGRGGDDIIDGDAWLNVQMSAPGVNGVGPAVRANSMTELQERVFSGELDPGAISIVREIVTTSDDSLDTAVFKDVLANYIIDAENHPLGYITVTHVVDGEDGSDGTDILRNIERLQFSDQSLVFGGFNSDPFGEPVIDDITPTEDVELNVSSLLVSDADLITDANPEGLLSLSGKAVAYFWQMEVEPGIFEDILIENAGGEVARATGPTFAPRGFEVGFALRVRAVYQDNLGVLETVFSAATALVESNNVAAGGQVLVSDTTPTETQTLQALNQITDADGLPDDPAAFSYQWQQSAPGGGAVFTNILGATASSFTPGQDQVNRQLRVVVSFTDDQGHPESVTSAPTIVTGDFIAENALGQALTGNAGQDMIFGGGGNDNLNGLAEDDLLDGGEGVDTILGGAGNDTITGGAGNDTNLNGQAGNDRFVATVGDGNDSYNGAGDTDTYDLSLTSAGATVTTTTSSSAQTGSDTLNAIENVIGSQGNDTITLNGGVNVIDGQDGDDVINAGAGADVVTGGAGNDTLIGAAGADTLTGGIGNDTLTGGAAADNLDGGEGDDIFHYLIGDGGDNVIGGAGNDRVNIVGAAGAQSLAVVLAGTAIAAFAGSTVEGVEEFTADLVDGAGADALTYGATTTAVSVNLAAGSATGFLSIANVDNVTGGTGNDTLVGSAGNNTLAGAAGDDTLTGGAGVDALNGGAGNDNFIATLGDGNDAYVGAGGTDDTYDLSGTAANATVNLQAGTASSSETGNDTVATIEHVIGGSGNDTLTGSGAANTLEGGGGADTLNGGGGADMLSGGAGNDILNGEAGADVITGGADNDTVDGGAANDRFVATLNDGNDSYAGGAGSDTLDLSGVTGGAVVTTTTAVGLEIGSDTLSAIENVIGTQGNDTITLNGGVNLVDGQDGNDTIDTGAGVDRVIGGQGDDTMNSGAGNDVFGFASGFGNDTINGFDAIPDGGNAQDRLDIAALGVTAATFATSVDIDIVGANTLVTIDGMGSILLVGVNGVGTNAITQTDFLLAT